MSKFSLSPHLRSFLSVSSQKRNPLLGYRLPISIVAGYSVAKQIRVFPENGYDFFLGREISDIYTLADFFDLSVYTRRSDNSVIIIVSDYSID